MRFDYYQEEAMKFRLKTADEQYVLLNLVGEVGELYSKLAKSIRDGSVVTTEDVQKEIGDILWMLAALCHDEGVTLGDCAYKNIRKLDSRSSRGVIMGNGDER